MFFILFSVIAALIHIYIFVMESLLWGTPKVNKTFNVTPDQAKENQGFAFNQGFYNLFLALGLIIGIIFSQTGRMEIGNTLMIYSELSIVGAAAVLIYSDSKLIRAALIQGVPPLLALFFYFLGF